MAGNEVVYLDRIEAHWPLGLRFEPGSRVPLHCTAMGKTFLAHLPAGQRQRFVDTLPLKRYTRNTITIPKNLLSEIIRIRQRGVATDNQEFISGVICVAVPIFAPTGDLCAAVALSAPESRLTLKQALRHVPALQKAANKLSTAFLPGD